MRVDDDGILFVIPSQTSCIEVGTADSTEAAVNHDDFGMMESWLVHPYFDTGFHQLVGIVETAVGRQGNVALDRQHEFYFHPSFHGILQGFLQITLCIFVIIR